MSEGARLQAPIECVMKVSIVSDDQSGTVTIGLGKGRIPTEDEVRQVLKRFEAEQMPPGFRLMTKREWFDGVLGEALDGVDEDGEPVYIKYAMPGGDDWAP